MFQPNDFVKLTNNNGINNDFQFREGLNEDIYKFNKNKKCSKGGFYFCKYKDVYEWLGSYNNALIWKVKIPEGEEIIEYSDKLKTNSIILSNPVCFYDDYERCKLAIKKNWFYFKFVKEQTEELCMLAIQKNTWAFNYLKKQTEEICKLAVKQNGLALQFVKKQTEEICKLAVKQNKYAIQFVKQEFHKLKKY